MKNIYIKPGTVATLLAMLFFALPMSAQNTLRSGYFLEGNSYRYRLNPAMMPERNFISLPVLGNLNMNTEGNVGLSHFVFDAPGGNDLVTFMHSSVGEDDFLGKLESDNVVRANFDVTLMSAGFYAFGGYNTVDLGFHSRSGMNLPYDMLRFMKVMGSDNYTIRDLNVASSNYVDIALGHSHKITEDLTVGARAKFILGLAYAEVMFDRMDISMSGSRWLVNAKGKANIAMGGAFKHSSDRTVNSKPAVSGYDDVAVGVNGYGFGVDLGVTYDFSNILTKGLKFSFAVNDIGFISWKNVAKAAVSPESPFEFNGFENIAIHDDTPGTNLEDQFDDLKEDLENFFTLEDKGQGGENSMLSATMNIGVEYRMPFYDRLSAGLLFSNRFDKVFPCRQLSLMLNVAPLKWLEMAVSGTVTNYGMGFGAVANIHCTGFNLFVGTDCFAGKVGKQYIPVNDMNASVAFGINIPFGTVR